MFTWLHNCEWTLLNFFRANSMPKGSIWCTSLRCTMASLNFTNSNSQPLGIKSLHFSWMAWRTIWNLNLLLALGPTEVFRKWTSHWVSAKLQLYHLNFSYIFNWKTSMHFYIDQMPFISNLSKMFGYLYKVYGSPISSSNTYSSNNW